MQAAEEEEEHHQKVDRSLEECATRLTPLLQRLTAYVTPTSDAFAAEVGFTLQSWPLSVLLL